MSPLQSAVGFAPLASVLRGRIVTPEHSDYDSLRLIVPGGYDQRPAAIVRPLDAADVQRALAFARTNDLTIAIRSGGHSPYSTTEGGLVLDLRDMNAFQIDVEKRVASAGSGLTAGEYSRRAGEHDLATGFGDTGTVGIGGITLGGGVGFLTRKFGLSIDSLLGAEIVTADGEILDVDATSHPDLFWALRGGGGNFGVVTRFRFQLHPVPRIYGGLLILPASEEAIERMMAAAIASDERLSAIVNIMPAPPMPFLPKSAYGTLIVMAHLCYADDDAAAGEAAMAPFRALGPAMLDTLRVSPYPELFLPEDDFRPVTAIRTMFLDEVDGRCAETIVNTLRKGDTMGLVQLRTLGGAVARVENDATAFAHRGRAVMGAVVAFCETLDERPQRQAWTTALAIALQPDDRAAYVNFIVDEEPDRARDAYPAETWRKLTAIKAKYDPANVFRCNVNVPPEASRL